MVLMMCVEEVRKNSCIINVACLIKLYLKLSYFSGTLILAIFCRQGFSIFLF